MTVHGVVAVRVAELCLDRRGRLSSRLICSTAVRAGLLVDLALAGRLTEEDDGIDLDASPTGYPPTDLLLREVTDHPGTSLDGWLARPRPGLRDVAEEAVASGRWVLRRGLHLGPRFQVPDDGQDAPDRLGATATTAIACAAGLSEQGSTSGQAPSSELLDSTGPHRWLVTALTDHLCELGARYATQAQALRNGGSVGPF